MRHHYKIKKRWFNINWRPNIKAEIIIKSLAYMRLPRKQLLLWEPCSKFLKFTTIVLKILKSYGINTPPSRTTLPIYKVLEKAIFHLTVISRWLCCRGLVDAGEFEYRKCILTVCDNVEMLMCYILSFVMRWVTTLLNISTFNNCIYEHKSARTLFIISIINGN